MKQELTNFHEFHEINFVMFVLFVRSWLINYQLALTIPGISPLLANSLKQILHISKSLI